jgi:hypothetical protein
VPPSEELFLISNNARKHLFRVYFNPIPSTSQFIVFDGKLVWRDKQSVDRLTLMSQVLQKHEPPFEIEGSSGKKSNIQNWTDLVSFFKEELN